MKTNDNVLNILNYSDKKPRNHNLLFLKNNINNKVNSSLYLKKFDEEIYFWEINEIINKYSLLLKNSKNHEEEAEIYEDFVHKLWHINDIFDLPIEYKYLVTETKDIVSKIKSKKWKLDIGLNSYIIPWRLSSIKKLIDYGIVKESNISISFWNWVNMQEWVRFVKHTNNWHSSAVTHFDMNDKIEKLNINLWDNSSIAHSTTFQLKKTWKDTFSYDLKTWTNVFLWINTKIWSNVKIWDNSSIWWGTVLKDDVTIWKNVIIWEWVKIRNWINIQDNCLVPNWAIIREDYEIISYEDYIKNELYYDTKKVEKRKRRNFVIKLSNESKEKRLEQMNKINKDYSFMSIFNEKYVSPENKLFAVINTILAIINKHFPKVWVIKETKFKSNLSLEQLKSLDLWLDDFLLEWELKKQVKLCVKAFPKNKENFLIDFLPQVIESIKKWEDITSKIKDQLDFPKIPKNKEDIFLGSNYITWKCEVDYTSFIYDTYIRSDELWEKDEVKITNSKIVKWVLHGWWDKIIENSKVIYTVVHWKMKIFDSKIGNYKHSSVYHNCELNKTESIEWFIVANWVNILNSKIWFWVIFLPFKNPFKEAVDYNVKDTEISDGTILWNSVLEKCIIWENSYIWNWLLLNWKYIEWKVYWLDKHQFESPKDENSFWNMK